MNSEELKISYVKQAHKISRSVYMMPSYCRKLIFFAMAHSAFQENDFETIEVGADDIFKALGMSRGGEQDKRMREITSEAKGAVYTIEEDGYEHINWLAKCQYVKSRDVFKFRLDSSLKDYVTGMRDNFAFIPLSSVGKLQGKYALRIFELVLSQSGHEGQNGNRPGCWYHEDSIENLRFIFKATKSYKTTGEFRRNVIDIPIKEINEANIGLKIKPVYLRKGRYLKGVRFEVKRNNAFQPKDVTPVVTESDREDEEIKIKYKEKFDNYFKEAMDQMELGFMEKNEFLKEQRASAAAIKRIKEEIPKKRGKKK